MPLYIVGAPQVSLWSGSLTLCAQQDCLVTEREISGGGGGAIKQEMKAPLLHWVVKSALKTSLAKLGGGGTCL